MYMPQRRKRSGWYDSLMNKVLAGLCGGAVLFGALAWLWAATPSGEVADMRGRDTITIVLTEKGFTPRDFTVSRGPAVVFTTTRGNQFWPASNEHPSHDLYSEFDPKHPIDADASWSFVFDRSGEWGFHDHIRSYFTGRVYVE